MASIQKAMDSAGSRGAAQCAAGAAVAAWADHHGHQRVHLKSQQGVHRGSLGTREQQQREWGEVGKPELWLWLN